MASDESAERFLVDRARSGDRDAKDTLWRSHRRWVAAIVLVHRPRAVDVDDLMQEVALKFTSKIGTLRDPEAFRPWLRRIVVNACRGAARSLRPTLHLMESDRAEMRPGGSDLVAAPQAPDLPADGQAEQHDAASRLLDQLLTLPSDYREPLLLRCVRGMSYQQISEVLDLPVTTIETRLARARRMLREELDPQSDSGEVADAHAEG